MKVVDAIAEVLKREQVKFIIGYPVNPIFEAAAKADLRTLKSLRGRHHAKHELAHAKAPKP